MIVSQGPSDIAANLLILGGTTEASRLAAALAPTGVKVRLSFAGRTEKPRDQPVPTRSGGFGGAEGLAAYIRDNGITHLIDATHPFAAQISANAAQAAAECGAPLIALTRAPWKSCGADAWRRVADVDGAVAALEGEARRVLLAIGRLHLDAFAGQPQHHYILRLVDPPAAPPPLPSHEIIVARGPFSVVGDAKLLTDRKIDLVVAKNAGGTGAAAKIVAARSLGVPVVMIDRPAMPEREEVVGVDAVLAWLARHGVDLGV